MKCSEETGLPEANACRAMEPALGVWDGASLKATLLILDMRGILEFKDCDGKVCLVQG